MDNLIRCGLIGTDIARILEQSSGEKRSELLVIVGAGLILEKRITTTMRDAMIKAGFRNH